MRKTTLTFGLAILALVFVTIIPEETVARMECDIGNDPECREPIYGTGNNNQDGEDAQEEEEEADAPVDDYLPPPW